MDLNQLQVGKKYVFHTTDFTAPDGGLIPGEAKTRTFVGIEERGCVGMPKLPFVEVQRDNGTRHLIAVECIQSIIPAWPRKRDSQVIIQSSVLTQAHALVCPSCGEPVFVAHPDRSEVPGGGAWLRDGDTVGGLYQLLTDEQRTPSAFDCELLVGGCRSCGNDYYVTVASFMDADYEAVDAYLCFNTDLGPERNFLCSLQAPSEGVPTQWVMHEYSTQVGLMHHHVFGPWALEDTDGVIGPHGVSMCGHGAVADPWANARTLLHTTWDALRVLRLGKPVSQVVAMDA